MSYHHKKQSSMGATEAADDHDSLTLRKDLKKPVDPLPTHKIGITVGVSVVPRLLYAKVSNDALVHKCVL